jgi:hypothetical protein
MDHSSITQKDSEKGKFIANHYHSWKEHPKFNAIVKFGCKIRNMCLLRKHLHTYGLG